MAAWIKMQLGMEIGVGPGDFVLDGDPASPPQKGGGAPKFSAHLYRGQMAGWIKMVLGMEICLSPGDFVLNGDPARPLNFLPMFIMVALCNRADHNIFILLSFYLFSFLA